MAKIHLTENITSTANVPAVPADIDVEYRFIGFDGNLCAAGAKAWGINQTTAKQGKPLGIGCTGEIIVEAGGVVTAEGEVESDASGRAVDKATGVSNGWALDSATSAGQYVRVVRGI